MAIAELSIIVPKTSISDQVSEVVKVVDASGLSYKVTPMGTIIQGNVDELFDLMKKCHQVIAEQSERVYTTITIDDRKGVENPMEQKVHSVEEKVGHISK